MRVTAGDLKERIVLLKRTVFEDDQGEVYEHWREEKRLWAAVKPMALKGGYETEGWRGEKGPMERFEVTMRPCHVQANRVTWRGENFKIIAQPKMGLYQQWMSFVMEKKNDQ